jgi:hypothetical protein
MKDFEKALRNLPKPDVPVEEFKQGLHAELNRVIRRRAGNGYQRRFTFASAIAGVLVVVLGLFVLQPQIPTRLHAVISGAAPDIEQQPMPALPQSTSSPRSTQALPQQLEALFRTSSATAEIDRSVVEDWYRRQALPVGVGKLEEESIFAVRQFQLTNGERIVVLSELGQQPEQPSMSF